jgi:hypothetical protein
MFIAPPHCFGVVDGGAMLQSPTGGLVNRDGYLLVVVEYGTR